MSKDNQSITGVIGISYHQGILLKPPLTRMVLNEIFLYVPERKKCILFEKSCPGFEKQKQLLVPKGQHKVAATFHTQIVISCLGKLF